MDRPSVTITKINVVARRFEETLAFYRLLGVDIPTYFGEPADTRHAPANTDDGSFAVDNDVLARLYNAGWRSGKAQQSVLIIAQVATREAVDHTFLTLIDAGHTSLQAPYDTFWGSRLAIVEDPEGNAVGIESPSEDAFRSWPPQPSADA